jgi:cytochrome P450
MRPGTWYPSPMRAPLCSSDPTELFSPAVIDDPHPFFARVRAEHPVSRVGESGVHLVASWALVDEALRRTEDFSANLSGVLVQGDDGLPAVFSLGGPNQVIATADEPRHAVHRALAQPRLAQQRILALEPTLRAWAQEAIAPWVAAGGGDFMPVGETVPARAVAHLLGLPDGDVQRYRTWAMMGGDMLAGAIDSEQLIAFAQETARMVAYLREHLDAAREAPLPGPDAPLLHALARGVQAGRIEVDEALGIAVVMFGAGGESTSGLIGSAVRLLAEDAALADALRADPTRIPAFVEEAVRLEPPFKFHYRLVTRGCELGGAQLEAGDRLMLLWAAANRDPAVFDAPDRIRFDRRHPKLHMSFGRGLHFCIGATLARLEARIVVEELLARTQRVAIAPGASPVHAHSIFVRRLEHLPLSVEG